MQPGERIKEIREEKKLSQKEFSRRLGYSSGYLAEIELGKKQPSREFLKKLLEVFSISSDYVLYGSPGERAQNLFLKFKLMQDKLKELKAIPEDSITVDEKAILRVLRLIKKEDSLSVLKELLKKAEKNKGDGPLTFLGPLKESFETLRDIVQKEEWKVGADYEMVLWSLDELIRVGKDGKKTYNWP